MLYYEKPNEMSKIKMAKLITVTTANAEDDIEISISNFVVSDDTSVNAKLLEAMEHLHEINCQAEEDGSNYANNYASWRDDEFLVQLYEIGADSYSVAEANTVIAEQSIEDMILVTIKETDLSSLLGQPDVYLPDHIG